MVILLFYYCTAMTSGSANLKLSLTKSDTKIQRSLGLKILSITSCVTLHCNDFFIVLDICKPKTFTQNLINNQLYIH